MLAAPWPNWGRGTKAGTRKIEKEKNARGITRGKDWIFVSERATSRAGRADERIRR